EEAFTSAVTQAQGYFQNKSIEEVTEDIKLKAKNLLVQQSTKFTKEDFKHFIPLFKTIQVIQQKTKLNDLETVNKENNTSTREIKKTKEFRLLTKERKTYTEEDHFNKGSETTVKLYK